MKRIILVLLLLAPFSFSIAQQFFSLKHYPYSSFGAHDASLKFEFKNHDNPVKYKVILGDEVNYNNGRFDVTSDSIIYSDTVYNVSFDPISGMFQAFKAYAIDSLTNDTLGFIKSKAMLGNSDPGYQRVGFDYVINSLICLGAFKIDSMTYTSNSGYWNSNVTNELYHSESFGAPIADTILLQGAYSIDSICHGYYRFFSPIGFETSFYIDSLGSSSFPVDIITTDDDNSCNGTATATVQSVPPFLYSWDNGAFNASSTVGNLCHGNHTLSVVNGVGDTVTTNFVVQESLSYIISTMVDTSNCGGMAMVSNYSSNGPYQYSWDNSAYGGDSLIAGLCSGLHSLSIINVLGDTVHTTFSIDSVEVLGFAFSPDTSNCSGEAFVFANGSVDQYLWDGSSSNNTPQRWGLCYGYHTVTIIFSNGDTISRLFEIEDLAFLSSLGVMTFPDTLNCTGRAEAVVSSTTGPYQYSWDGGSYQSDSIINGLCVGVHELKVLNSLSDTAIKNFYIDSTFVIPQVDSLVINDVIINVTNSFTCYSKVEVTVNSNSGPFYYSWNGGSFGTENSLDSLCPAINTLRVVNTYGDTVNTEFITNSIAFIETQPSIDNCNGSMKVKILSGATNYWYSIDGINFTQDSIFENLCSQNYSLYVINTNNDTLEVDFTVEQFRVGIYTHSDSGSCNGVVIVDHNAFNSDSTLISYDGVNGLMGGLTFEDSLCEGVHHVWVFDGIVGTDTIVLPYAIASSENTWTHFNINGVVVDSLSIFSENCSIDYQISIDSAVVNSLVYLDSNNAELNVSVWQSGNELIFIDTVVAPHHSQGLFEVSVTFYCTQKSSNDVYKVVGLVEISNGVETNIVEKVKKPEFVIFPNPTAGIINVKIESVENAKFEVFSLNGKLLLTEYSSQIDISPLPKGLYILKCSSNSRNEIHKIIKE